MLKKDTMNKTSMHDSILRMRILLEKKDRHTVPKGEIWLGSSFLKSAGFEDTLDNHFRLATQLGQDLVCLPVAEKSQQNVSMGYRYFEPGELSTNLRNRTKLLAAVVDGPFQRMVNKRGLMEVLVSWVQDRESTMATYAAEQEITLMLIDRCLAKGVDAVILADDLSGNQAPLINPLDLDSVCTPFYAKAVSSIRDAGGLVFLHCCGNLEQLVPMITSWDLDGLAAIQISKNDIDLLDKEIGGILLAGIGATVLEKNSFSPDDIESLVQFVTRFANNGRLILCSNCGLYRSDFWGRLQAIYERLEKDLSPNLL